MFSKSLTEMCLKLGIAALPQTLYRMTCYNALIYTGTHFPQCVYTHCRYTHTCKCTQHTLEQISYNKVSKIVIHFLVIIPVWKYMISFQKQQTFTKYNMYISCIDAVV